MFDHQHSGVVHNFGRVCLSDNNFWKPWYKKFIFAQPVYLQRIQVKFVYEGHQVKVREGKCRKSLFPQCKNLSGHKSSSIKHRTTTFACSMEFLATANRMAWPPSLWRDRKWTSVAKCTHLQVVSLKLEGNLLLTLISFFSFYQQH